MFFDCAEYDFVFFSGFPYSAGHAVFEDFGLVEYFFQHEVGESPFVKHGQVKVNFFYFVFGRACVEVFDLGLSAFDDGCDFFVFEVYDFSGVSGYRACIAGYEEFAVVFGYAYCKRGCFSCDYHGIGIAPVYYGNGVCACALPEGIAYSFGEVAVFRHGVFYQLYEYFGVCFAFEGVSFLREHVLEGSVVFDYAVMDEGDVS